jgi:hypothetical protein
MIESGQVEEAVHHEHRHPFFEGAANFTGLPCRHREGDGDVAEEPQPPAKRHAVFVEGKRKNVRGLVYAPERAVQRADACLAAQEKAKLSLPG